MRLLLILTFGGILIGCGNALTTPEDIRITRFPANTQFTLTIVMKTCSDTCATYDEGDCSLDVDRPDNTINVNASVGFDRNKDECSEMCGPEILVHCTVPALKAGTYTVKSGSFVHQIFLE